MLHRFTRFQCLYLLQLTPRRTTTSSQTPPLTGDPSPRPPGPPAEVRITTVLTKPCFLITLSWDSSSKRPMYTKYPDLLSDTDWRDQRSYYNVKDQKKLHERCHERMQNEKLSFGHEISFIWKTHVKDTMRTFDWAWYCPERATDPPRRQPPPTRRRTMPPRRTTPPRTRRPGQYTQHYTHCSAVCALMPLYILTVEIRSSDNTASITCTVAVMIWQYKYEILYFICKYVECVTINNQVLLSSNCVILY